MKLEGAISLPKPKNKDSKSKEESFSLKPKEKLLKSTQKTKLTSKDVKLKVKKEDIDSTQIVSKRKNKSQEKEREWEKPKLKIIVEKVILKDSQIQDEGKGIVIYHKGEKKDEEILLESIPEENFSGNDLKVGGKKKKISIDNEESFGEYIDIKSKRKKGSKKMKSKEK